MNPIDKETELIRLKTIDAIVSSISMHSAILRDMHQVLTLISDRVLRLEKELLLLKDKE